MKKQLIMDHALELFADKGIIDTSVQQITDRCGISKGAFYLAFKSKDELISALVDQYMTEYITDIDQLVRREGKESLLHDFFMYSYEFRENRKAFSSVYIKEQMHKMSETMLERLFHFDRLIDDVLFRLVDKLYEHKQMNEKYELVYIIKAFMQLYQMFAFQMEKELEINDFVQSITEKVQLLATKPTTSFITDDMRVFLQTGEVVVNAEDLQDKLREVLLELEDGIIKESVYLLKEQLVEKPLHEAVVQGLLRNIEEEAACKEIVYLYRKFVE